MGPSNFEFLFRSEREKRTILFQTSDRPWVATKTNLLVMVREVGTPENEKELKILVSDKYRRTYICIYIRANERSNSCSHFTPKNSNNYFFL